MNKQELAARLLRACSQVIADEAELTEIDSRFGDADHGLTMTRICSAIAQSVRQADGGIQSMLADAAQAVMPVHGGSAVSLWNTWLDGLQEAAPQGDELTSPMLKDMLAHGFSAVSGFSQARAGDKTMMDVLIPVQKAIAACRGDCDAVLSAAADAALAGAESTRNFVAQFGPAKNYGLQTLGTPDPGAASLACFFQGLALK